MNTQTLYESVAKYEHTGLCALRFEGKRISYGKLCKNIRRALTYLKNNGIREGDVVTLSLPNIPAMVYFFYAIDALGGISNIVHPLSTPAQIIESMKKTGSRHAVLLETIAEEGREQFSDHGGRFYFVNPMHDSSLFARHAFYLKYKRARTDGAHIFRADGFRGLSETKEIAARDPEETSIYLHSGGTTGEPKTIELSDRAVGNLALKVDKIIKEELRGQSMLAVLPAFHGFGLGMGIHAPLSQGATSYLMMKFNAKKVISAIGRGEINFIIGVPLLYRKLMSCEQLGRARLDRLKYCFVGGDNVQPALIEEFNRFMSEHGSDGRLYEGYGLTETVTVCTVNTKESSRTGSVGLPLDGIIVSVRDEFGVILDTDMTGEVYVSGDTTMNGYLGDPEATARTIVSADGREWVRTGDLGYIDSDGFLWLRGRMKRMFKLSGMNVYPSETEKLACSVDGVGEAAMEYYEEPKPHMLLFLLKERGCVRDEDSMKAEVMERLSASQLKYSLPSDIIFLEEFPRTKVGKTDHETLCKMKIE